VHLLLLRDWNLSTPSDLFVNMDETKEFGCQITFVMYLYIFTVKSKNIFLLINMLCMIFFISL